MHKGFNAIGISIIGISESHTRSHRFIIVFVRYMNEHNLPLRQTPDSITTPVYVYYYIFYYYILNIYS